VAGGSDCSKVRWNSRARLQFLDMVHPLLAASEFRGPALTALNATFERVCDELKLNPRPDPFTDLVAEVVLQCMRDGKTDPTHILKCARQSLNLKSGDRDRDPHAQSKP
jgi:hypothetical protein